MLLKENNDTQPYVENAAYMFDAIWTAALAINKTVTRLSKINLMLKDFTYEDNYKISGIIYEEVLKVQFFGLTVSILASYMVQFLMSKNITKLIKIFPAKNSTRHS